MARTCTALFFQEQASRGFDDSRQYLQSERTSRSKRHDTTRHVTSRHVKRTKRGQRTMMLLLKEYCVRVITAVVHALSSFGARFWTSTALAHTAAGHAVHVRGAFVVHSCTGLGNIFRLRHCSLPRARSCYM